jgi:hypothetical protein
MAIERWATRLRVLADVMLVAAAAAKDPDRAATTKDPHQAYAKLLQSSRHRFATWHLIPLLALPRLRLDCGVIDETRVRRD